MQANDVNYLVPVEEVENDALLKYKALEVQDVLQRVESRGCHLNLVLLDACRSKPSTMRRGSRDIGRGLAKMEARAGSVIAFACEAGDTAADGSGRNGVFTDKLLQHLGRPGVDVDFMLGDVASEVEKATSGKQKPFRNHNLQGARPCCLLAPEPAVAASDTKATIVPAELAAWLKELALEVHGPRLVADHKIAFLRDLRFMEEKDLTDSGLGKIEAKRFVAAAAKLGATQRISGAVVEAAAVAEDPKVQEKALELKLSPEAQQFADQMVGETGLDLSSNNIGDGGAIALAEALKVNASLTVLYLMSNGISPAGASALAEMLKLNTSLTVLNLNYNNIGAGASALAEVFKVNTSLTDLDLNNNNIGDGGAIVLAEALKVNTSLTVLDLSSNNIGDGGAIALAEALKVHTSPMALDLYNNSIGAGGAIALAQALKVNTSLTMLDLRSNRIGAGGASALAEALKVNTSLTELYLDGNGISSAVVQTIRKCAHSGCKVVC